MLPHSFQGRNSIEQSNNERRRRGVCKRRCLPNADYLDVMSSEQEDDYDDEEDDNKCH